MLELESMDPTGMVHRTVMVNEQNFTMLCETYEDGKEN